MTFWISSALRQGSLLSLSHQTFVDGYDRMKWVYFTFFKTRISADHDPNSHDSRTMPSDLISRLMFPVERDWIRDVILEPSTQARHKRVGIVPKNEKDFNDAPHYTGHSARRTFACHVRLALTFKGYNVDVKKPKIPVEILHRLNECGGWSPDSDEVWEYSGDFRLYEGHLLLVDKRVLEYILSGTF